MESKQKNTTTEKSECACRTERNPWGGRTVPARQKFPQFSTCVPASSWQAKPSGPWRPMSLHFFAGAVTKPEPPTAGTSWPERERKRKREQEKGLHSTIARSALLLPFHFPMFPPDPGRERERTSSPPAISQPFRSVSKYKHATGCNYDSFASCFDGFDRSSERNSRVWSVRTCRPYAFSFSFISQCARVCVCACVFFVSVFLSLSYPTSHSHPFLAEGFG